MYKEVCQARHLCSTVADVERRQLHYFNANPRVLLVVRQFANIAYLHKLIIGSVQLFFHKFIHYHYVLCGNYMSYVAVLALTGGSTSFLTASFVRDAFRS